MSAPWKTCPNGHVPTVSYGEVVDVAYCMDCGWEDRREHPMRAGVKRIELSVRDRGGKAGKKTKVR